MLFKMGLASKTVRQNSCVSEAPLQNLHILLCLGWLGKHVFLTQCCTMKTYYLWPVPNTGAALFRLHTPSQAVVNEGGDNANRKSRKASPLWYHAKLKGQIKHCEGLGGKEDVPRRLGVFKCCGLGSVSVFVCACMHMCMGGGTRVCAPLGIKSNIANLEE